MSVSIRCLVAATAASVTIPAQFLLDGKSIEDYFQLGSGGDIDLHVEQTGEVVIGRRIVDDAELQVALGDLTGNAAVAGLVTRIGFLVAGEYRPHPGAFGYMFDAGFTPDDAGIVPREGCGIFLDAISRLRTTTASFDTEVTFTAIHELGHVFNLWHVDASKNFMARSKVGSVFPVPIEWLPEHKTFLAKCSTAKEVHPGGTVFGRRGTLAAGDADPENLPRGAEAFGLDIRIDMKQREFLAFEPVELELFISAANGVTRSFEIPDALDPAYQSFEIWIEQPNEERRRYRPTKHFCTPTTTLTIDSAHPFYRDIGIFGSARGYTFRHAGVHKLWVRVAIPGVGLVVSNVLEVNVRPDPSSEQGLLLRRILQDRKVAHVLFYRSFPLRGRSVQAIEALRAQFGGTMAAAALEYAQGRALLRDAERADTPPTAKRRAAKGLSHLARAADHPALNAHQRDIATTLLRTDAERV